MAKWFSVYEFASGANAAHRSLSALIVTAVIATAAWSAASTHGSSNTDVPTAAIAKARRRGSIIATGSADIDNAVLRPACRSCTALDIRQGNLILFETEVNQFAGGGIVHAQIREVLRLSALGLAQHPDRPQLLDRPKHRS